MTETLTNSLPAHPGILPSFAVSFIQRPFDSPVGPISRNEFLGWTKAKKLTDHDATVLVHDYVRARRTNFDRIWDSIVKIDIQDDWRSALSPDEKVRFLPLIVQDRESFKTRTLRSIKNDTRLPVVKVLRVLAKLEALHWQYSPFELETRNDFQPTVMVIVEESFVQDILDCLESSWVDKLQSDDLRFPAVGALSFKQWLAAEVQSKELSHDAHAACLTMLKANTATWADELFDIAIALGKKAFPRAKTHPRINKHAEIFVGRYGGLSGLELVRVGEVHGVTRERIRQICDKLLQAISKQSIQLPALEKVLLAALQITPVPMTEANTRLVTLLGNGFGLESAIAFADLVGLDPIVKVGDSKAMTAEGYAYLAMAYDARDTPVWANMALSLARRDCMTIGCTNFARIAGLLAWQEQPVKEIKILKSLFECSQGFRLIDADSGWFTLSDNESCATATRMKKLMSVGDGVTNLDAVSSALMIDDQLFDRSTCHGLAIPPTSVLSVLFASWPWLTANKHNIYKSNTQLDPAEFLSETEYSALLFLKERGGAATRQELRSHITQNASVTPQAVDAVLAFSPIIQKLEHGVFGVRGWRVPVEAILKIRSDRSAGQREGGDKIIVRQTTSTGRINKRTLYLPSYLTGRYVGQFTHSNGVYRTIRISANNQILHLSKWATSFGISPGEQFELTLDLEAMTFDILRYEKP